MPVDKTHRTCEDLKSWRLFYYQVCDANMEQVDIHQCRWT